MSDETQTEPQADTTADVRLALVGPWQVAEFRVTSHEHDYVFPQGTGVLIDAADRDDILAQAAAVGVALQEVN